MNTYLVKNKEEHPILIRFNDGKNVKLRPGGMFLWQGPEDSMNCLQEYVDADSLDVIFFETDFRVRGLEPRPVVCCCDWAREGF